MLHLANCHETYVQTHLNLKQCLIKKKKMSLLAQSFSMKLRACNDTFPYSRFLFLFA